MKYIYIDESGDFGFSKKSTKNVVVAATFSHSPKTISIWMKRIKKRKLKKRLRKLNEIKAADASREFMEYFYQHANTDLNFSVYAIVVEKSKIPQRYRGEEGIVFVKCIEQLIDISKEEVDSTMYWYFDRRTVKKYTWEAIKTLVREKLFVLTTAQKPVFEVHPVESNRNINIQFADFIAYALGCYVNNRNDKWYKMIKMHLKKVETLKI